MTLEEYKKIDNNFSESMFITKVNNIVVKLLTSIMMNNLVEVDHFINDDVYNYANSIIEKNKKNNARQMYDELNVSKTTINNIIEKEDTYEITVSLIVKYLDYRISLDDGHFIDGNANNRVEIPHILTLQKYKDTKNQTINRKCPTCGASMDVNNSGRCIYCNSIYNQEDYDWVLINITT